MNTYDFLNYNLLFVLSFFPEELDIPIHPHFWASNPINANYQTAKAAQPYLFATKVVEITDLSLCKLLA